MRPKVRRVLVALNTAKAGTEALRTDLEKIFTQANVEALWELTRKANSTAQLQPYPLSSPLPQMIIACGGDGTLLQMARHTLSLRIPLLGINMGSLGFLTTLRREEIFCALPDILAGHYQLSRRQLLEFTIYRGGKKIESGWALNDVVVGRGHHSHMIRLGLAVDSETVTEYHCDGLIIATPTGSTAYSLSAGGPILSPHVHAFLITPICSHALTNRSLIAAPQEKMSIEIPKGNPSVALEVDGLFCTRLRAADRIEFGAAKQAVELVQANNIGFYNIVRQKLKWSGASV